ncbi:MAG: response regulator [Candidatus Magnetoovum sp. WYHC-5]|nr:response regulator [Candidatus Magnetoovum sp. WYHC-5]
MSKIKVLIIDDENDFASTFSERLLMRGYLSCAVNCAEKAFKTVKENAPDVVILDLKMPSMDGIEMLKVLKKMDPSIEVIVLTGHGLSKGKDEAIKHGAFDYLLKPADIDDIIERIERANKKRMLEQQYLASKRV